MSAKTFVGVVHEDGSFSVLARVASLDGSGEEYRPGEGNVLQIADVTAVALHIYALGTDPENDAGTEVTPTPSVDPADVLLDELQLTGWKQDLIGYNFRHDVPATYAPNARQYYLLEYKLTLVDDGIAWIKVRVLSRPTRLS